MNNSKTRMPYIFEELNRIKEIQIGIKPLLEDALEQKKIPSGHFLNNLGFENYNDYWKHTKSDVYFEISLLVRLGTIIEQGLRFYFMDYLNFKNTSELEKHIKNKCKISPNGLFQRWKNTNGNNVVALFKNRLGLDLEEIKTFVSIKEIIIHRHQFVHKLGIIDEKYINDILEVTGERIDEDDNVKTNYPDTDFVWAKATEKLELYINNTITFFQELTNTY